MSAPVTPIATPEQIVALEAMQRDPCRHPMTCPGKSPELACGRPDARDLIPLPTGWVCACGRYTQPYRRELGALMRLRGTGEQIADAIAAFEAHRDDRLVAMERRMPEADGWEHWRSRAEGLQAELDGALELLWAVGEREAVRLNFPRQAALLEKREPSGAVPPLVFTYTNWRGETSVRTVDPGKLHFGATEWHPEPQWLLAAFDHEKQAMRDFALRDMVFAKHPAGET